MRDEELEGKAFSRKDNFRNKRRDKKLIKDLNAEQRAAKLNKKQKRQEVDEEGYDEYLDRWEYRE